MTNPDDKTIRIATPPIGRRSSHERTAIDPSTAGPLGVAGRYRLVGKRDQAVTTKRWCGAAVVSMVLGSRAAPAAADADEASAHAHLIAGLARATEHDATGLGPVIGLGGRFTLARSDLWALEAQATAFRAAPHFDEVTITTGGAPRRGQLDRVHLGGRVEVGAHLRFGARWIPTLHGALGIQARWAGATSLRSDDGTALAGVAASSSTDVTAALSLGIDRRLGRSLVVGASLGWVHAFPITGDGGGLDSFELTAHAAVYFYPGWFPLSGWLGSTGGDT